MLLVLASVAERDGGNTAGNPVQRQATGRTQGTRPNESSLIIICVVALPPIPFSG